MNASFARALLFMAILVHEPMALALTTGKVDLVCPIDGEKFRQELAMSGTQFGQMLDLMPIGPIAAPWPLPVCPTSGFVVYRRDFKPEELEKFRAFVATPEYAAARAETPYYRVARLRAHLGDDRDEIAYSLLQATWEAESRVQYEKYAHEALAIYREILSGGKRDEKKWGYQQLIAGELERRLRRFEEARSRFTKLKELNQFKTGVLAEIVALQLRLIAQGDSGSHEIPRKGR